MSTQPTTRGSKKVEFFPDFSKRAISVWVVISDMGETWHTSVDTNPQSVTYGRRLATVVASKNSWNVELETSSFKLAKELAVELAQTFPLEKLMILKKAHLKTVIYPIT